jgi:hypothetical protein
MDLSLLLDMPGYGVLRQAAPAAGPQNEPEEKSQRQLKRRIKQSRVGFHFSMGPPEIGV